MAGQVLGIEPAVKFRNPATDSDVSLTLRVLESCCLLCRDCAVAAHRHNAVKPGSKAWRFYDPASRRAFVSRDVVFNEPASWTWEDEDMGATADFVIEYRTMDLGSDQFGADPALGSPTPPPSSGSGAPSSPGAPVAGTSMQSPAASAPGTPNKVLRLDKALYGLRQAPRAWNAKLDETLVALGFSHSTSEHAVYARGKGVSRLLVGVYVNDLIITGNDASEIVKFKH
ncbi:hypothetical protein E2562_024651 [Oryza meyeriana var. granulata]|uniref:Uncharacterized protein n=1 Tax=Oryza meyeriana var. granulata TaxID=110450 RepID=A0A6G1EBB1_9ORYZ|nr:hypothetical protein E2562_024651 [Oryza meyeriana var. granulata]